MEMIKNNSLKDSKQDVEMQPMEVDKEEKKEERKVDDEDDKLINQHKGGIRSSTSLSLDLGAKESDALKKLETLKAKHEKDQIYIFDCINCRNYVSLH